MLGNDKRRVFRTDHASGEDKSGRNLGTFSALKFRAFWTFWLSSGRSFRKSRKQRVKIDGYSGDDTCSMIYVKNAKRTKFLPKIIKKWPKLLGY